MKTLLNRYFVAFSFVWLIIFICTKLGFYFYWPIQYYLIDLLAVPILGQLCLWWMRLILQKSTYTLSKWNIILLIVGLTLIFEIYLPTKNARYTGDYFDVFMYILGGLFFLKYMNR
ncbi:hypothetical protein A5893_04005 [Pedobacter psychrophilus]|uniref:Magnesium citrate secondary transporter n=1 Tax=Pedobacter psychrophilus TaxID=1826909 RepID=A0A179DMX4_9SPHI|nr:hypothetical protein [Pedobacter psychrophilus]OAQ42284.1 hypothetical protein A5893_04005 [Pedobacter psychrophilus]